MYRCKELIVPYGIEKLTKITLQHLIVPYGIKTHGIKTLYRVELKSKKRTFPKNECSLFLSNLTFLIESGRFFLLYVLHYSAELVPSNLSYFELSLSCLWLVRLSVKKRMNISIHAPPAITPYIIRLF